MEEKTLSIFVVIKNIFQSFFRLVGDLKSLAAAETQLAVRSFAIIVGLSLIGLLLSFSTWR